MRRILVAGEVALALVVLTGTGLLVRSFASLVSVDLGFRPGHLLTFRSTFRPPSTRPPDPLTFAIVCAAMLAIAICAALLPAHRAISIDPMQAPGKNRI